MTRGRYDSAHRAAATPPDLRLWPATEFYAPDGRAATIEKSPAKFSETGDKDRRCYLLT